MSGYILGKGATGVVGNYYQIRDLVTAQILNLSALESYNVANWADYVLSTSEQTGSGVYPLAIPGYLPAGFYNATLYTPLGGSPASGDTPIWDKDFVWDGANLVSLGSSLNVGKINGSSAAAVNLAITAASAVVGVAASGTLSTTQMTTNLTNTVETTYTGRVLYFTSGLNAGRAALITAYAVTGGKLTFIGYNNLPISSAPVAGDGFVII